MDPGTQELESTGTTVKSLRMHTRIGVRHVVEQAPAIVLVHGLGVSGYRRELAPHAPTCALLRQGG